MDEHLFYENPLSKRYASREMSTLFSPHFKYTTWRRLWIALAKAEKQLGLPITSAQIEQMQRAIHPIDYARALEIEKETRHDVMAHILAFGEASPDAKKIIHLGATSAFVTDNTDLIQMKEALKLLQLKLVVVIRNLSNFASIHADEPCLSYTHFQPAQPTTVGKRACMWLQDFLIDLKDTSARIHDIRFLGAKGATGSQASFLALFEGNKDKIEQLDNLIAEEMGFSTPLIISGQTYTRKQDLRVTSCLGSIAVSAHKFGTDLRLLSHTGEMTEPFHEKQVGSSAMPYKRNPIYSERICGLARFLISLGENASYTAATQWLERSLDDSANRRLYIPESFLAADAILNLLCYNTAALQVHSDVILRALQEELPYFATENILMLAVKRGGDRQILHEKLKNYTLSVSTKQGEALLDRIAKDPDFKLTEGDMQWLLKPENFIGRAPDQVREFLDKEVEPHLRPFLDEKPPLPIIEV